MAVPKRRTSRSNARPRGAVDEHASHDPHRRVMNGRKRPMLTADVTYVDYKDVTLLRTFRLKARQG